jgi:hypothetical protein
MSSLRVHCAHSRLPRPLGKDVTRAADMRRRFKVLSDSVNLQPRHRLLIRGATAAAWVC